MAMAASDAKNLARFVNPWALHLQKLGLELKCPLCLNLVNKPKLLPCNHIFCLGCIPKSAQIGSECPACKHKFVGKELRPVPFIENMVTIYRSLDATFTATVSQPLSYEAGMSSEPRPGDSVKIIEDKSSKEVTCSDGISTDSLDVNMKNRSSLSASTEKISASAKETMLTNDVPKDIYEQHGGLGSNSKNQMVLLQGVKSTNELQKVERYINHKPQLSPGSSNSFSAVKDMDGSSSDPQSRLDSAGNCKSKRSSENELDSERAGINSETTSEDDFQASKAKRPKQLSYGSLECVQKSYDHIKLGSSAEDVAVSCCKMQSRIIEHHPVAQGPEAHRGACAFCHSSELTDGSGPMLYYANGREVVGDISHLSKVIPVHSKCIEWTPQVYYEGDRIKNLESELSRAAKLKCNSCGLKGAGLGCYAKTCRRSYHVPCAFEIEECRWDCDDFLVLCPSHNRLKFPREKSTHAKLPRLKSKSVDCSSAKRDLVIEQMSSKASNFWASSCNGQREWVLCGSALSLEEKYVLVKFGKMCGATVTKNWNPSVTHVIAATDANGACTRTLKYLMGILHGRWILSMDWVKACMEANCPVNEEPFEVGLDNHGCQFGPKSGRLIAMSNATKLFDGLSFYFNGDYPPAFKRDLLSLVETAGGMVIGSKEELTAKRKSDPDSTPASRVVVYNREPPQGCLSGEEGSIVGQRIKESEELAKTTCSVVARHTWILESIAGSKLLPFRC